MLKTIKFFLKFGLLFAAGMIISVFGPTHHEKNFTIADIKNALAPNQVSADVTGGSCGGCGCGCCGCW